MIDDDADLLYRNYEILSEFYKKHFVDLRVLDATCDPETVPGPGVLNGRVKAGLFLNRGRENCYSYLWQPLQSAVDATGCF